MKYECGVLLKALDSVKDIAKSIRIREKTACVMLAHNQIIAQNDECYIAFSFDHNIEMAVLPFDKLYNLISYFPASTKVAMSKKDGKVVIKLKGKTKSSQSTIAEIQDEDIAYIDPPLDGWDDLPDDFETGLKLCRFCLPKESLNPALTTFGIDGDTIYTSDDFRISKYKMSDSFDRSFTISGDNGGIIIANNFLRYMLEDTYIDLRKGDVFARIMLGIDEYPKIAEDLFSYDEKVTVAKSSFLTALDRASLFAEGLSEIDYAMEFFIKDNSYTFKAQNEFGKNTENGTLKGSISKDLSVNPVYLSQALKNLSSKKCDIGIDENNRLIFAEKGFSHILATYNK